MVKDDSIALAENATKMAQKLGADQTEAFLLKGYQYSINLEESSIVKANKKSLTGIGLRVLKDKAIGIASSSKLQDSLIEATVQDAVSLAKVSKPDPNNIGFASQQKSYPKVTGLYNADLANLESKELVELAIEALNASLERDETINVGGSITLNVGSKIIVNSNGINIQSKTTALQIFLSNKIVKDEDIGVGMEFGFGRSLDEINFEKIGKSATEKAFSMLGGQKIESAMYPFILDERATRTTINGILSRGVSAYNIIQGTAFFNDRLGEEIASPALTVYDNPIQDNGIFSRTFDDEGSATQKVSIVEKGTLLSYLSDVYTAKKLDIPNTGSASKQGYEGIPRPQLQLTQIEPGTATKEELFEELGTGLYLERGLFSMAGTNISQQVDVGYWVEKGEIKFPVKNTMLGTTVYDVLKNIQLIGKDLLIEGGMHSPMVLVGPTKFSSGR
ncbi:MAG TPA: TldD/PmbA family protein [candidate division Zixibacteria bacterium]|nr:TldD/PmbA family protein [candidate division Zixibacteria bacterium]